MALLPADAADGACCEPSDDDERLLLELLADPAALELELELSQDEALEDALADALASPSNDDTATAAPRDPGALITKAVAAAITRRRRRSAAAGCSSRKKRPKAKDASAAAKDLAAPDASSARKLLKYNSNKARDERREELLYLRRKVAELETRLAEMRVSQPAPPPPLQDGAKREQQQLLQLAAAAASSSGSGDEAGDVPSQAPPTTAVVRKAGVWEEISGRQHELRMKAERENIRLKLVLESQLKIARSLEKLLKKTASAKEFDKLARGGDRVHVVRPPPSHHKDAELFGKLLADVETSYAEVDQVFEAVGLARMEPSRIDARVQQRRPKHDSGGGGGGSHQIELQVFGSKVLPFDMHAAGLAVWNHYVFAKERTPNRLYCHNQAPHSVKACDSSTEDTVLENFNMEVDVSGTLVLYCMKLVLRRYVEPSRVVVVWRAFFDPTHVANEPLAGVRFLEKGYVVVRQMDPPPSDGGAGNAQSHNLLQTCFISTPVSIGDLVHAEPSKVGALTDLVLRSTAANVASSHQMIENVLLEQALARDAAR